MKIKKWLMALVVLAVLGMVLGRAGRLFLHRQTGPAGVHIKIYYCPMHPNYTAPRPGNCPICNMSLVLRGDAATAADGAQPGPKQPREFTLKEILSMKPQEICLLHKCKMGNCMIAMTEEMARLGKCPHCGEDLGVIIKDFAPEGYSKVKLSPEKQQLVGIKTAMAAKKNLTKTIRTSGKIAYDPDLYQAEEEYLQAVRAEKKAAEGSAQELKAQASSLVDASRTRLKLMGLSDELIGEIAKADKPDRSLLLAEGGGTVWLYAAVYEYEISMVKVGSRVDVEAPGITQELLSGTIRSIDSVVDPATRTVRVRAVLENPGGALKPQMYVNAVLKVELGEVLTAPSQAVFSTGEKNVVFVAKEGNVFEPRLVTLGAKSEGDTEIKQGISAGETVVTSGNFLIDSESQLKAALDGMDAGG
ncbi:MAG: efflux RND transporter periplasmic adaptor subunit [Candidatus Omnitrophota bacterium]|jgi:Cu(I)/Ag(I) efflux system membrane fusion protein